MMFDRRVKRLVLWRRYCIQSVVGGRPLLIIDGIAEIVILFICNTKLLSETPWKVRAL